MPSFSLMEQIVVVHIFKMRASAYNLLVQPMDMNFWEVLDAPCMVSHGSNEKEP